MPYSDMIIPLDTHLAILINYSPYQLLPDSDTVTVINEARSRIPTGAAVRDPIPDRLVYTSGNVFLTLSPQINVGMYWGEWEATLRGLLWFREQYVALAMAFTVMDTLEGMAIMGTGMLSVGGPGKRGE